MVRGIWTLISMTGLPRLIFRLMMDRRVPFWQKLFLPIAALYVIMPWDFVPDFLLFMGRIDDLLAVALACLMLILLAPRDVLMELAGSSPRRNADAGRDSGTTVIEGEYRTLDE